VRLAAGQTLQLADSARISATGMAGQPGTVQLSSRDGQVVVDPQARINVAGSGNSSGGEVLVRAPRLADGGVAVGALAGRIQGAARVVVEAVKVYEADTIVVGDLAPAAPTSAPTATPTLAPTAAPTTAPTAAPTTAPKVIAAVPVKKVVRFASLCRSDNFGEIKIGFA
jgi:hypothetical protein